MEILNIGALELIIILLIMFILLGPKEMILTAQRIGAWIRRFIRSPLWREIMGYSQDIRELPKKLMDETGLQETLKEVQESTQSAVKDINQSVKEAAEAARVPEAEHLRLDTSSKSEDKHTIAPPAKTAKPDAVETPAEAASAEPAALETEVAAPAQEPQQEPEAAVEVTPPLPEAVPTDEPVPAAENEPVKHNQPALKTESPEAVAAETSDELAKAVSTAAVVNVDLPPADGGDAGAGQAAAKPARKPRQKRPAAVENAEPVDSSPRKPRQKRSAAPVAEPPAVVASTESGVVQQPAVDPEPAAAPRKPRARKASPASSAPVQPDSTPAEDAPAAQPDAQTPRRPRARRTRAESAASASVDGEQSPGAVQADGSPASQLEQADQPTAPAQEPSPKPRARRAARKYPSNPDANSDAVPVEDEISNNVRQPGKNGSSRRAQPEPEMTDHKDNAS